VRGALQVVNFPGASRSTSQRQSPPWKVTTGRRPTLAIRLIDRWTVSPVLGGKITESTGNKRGTEVGLAAAQL